MLTAARVLSRIFLYGGKPMLKKIFEPRCGDKKIFRPSRGPGHAPPENFENIGFRIWLKSHFWTLVTFTDSLKSSSKKSLFEIVVFFSVKLLEGRS